MINSIHGVNTYGLYGNQVNAKNSGNGFSELLGKSLDNINTYQKVYEDSMVSFIKGEENEVHNVMIAMQEAKLSLQMAVELRNKLIEAYQEISKIQI